MNQYGQPPPYTENAGYGKPATYYQGPTEQNIYPPQPPQPAVQPTHSTVIIHSTNAPNIIALGMESTRITCPSCHADVLTNIERTPNSRTHCWAIILCLFVCWPCVCLPYCMDSCRSANHYCPNCRAYIGTYEN